MPRAGTILDYLDEDCWIVLLGYIPLRDIIQSESTSRQWQRRVLNYLSHIRVGVMLYAGGDVEYIRRKKWGIVANMSNVRWVALNETYILSFESWTNKLGTSIVASYCYENNIHIIGRNCPNLEGSEFLNVSGELLLKSKYENYHCLKHLCFSSCGFIPDDSLDQLIRSPVLEDLSIMINGSVTGQCFANITSKNLKNLHLQYCNVKMRYLAAASHHFKELRKLVIKDNMLDPDAKNILLVLEKTLKLERLFTFGFGKLVDGLFEAVCRLRCLKELEIDVPGSDEALEAVTRRCPELQILKFQECRAVTGRGVAAMCVNAGARLTELKLPQNNLTDDDVVACIKACPNLKVFDLPCSQRLTPKVVARAAACRELCRCDLLPNEPDKNLAIDELDVLDLPLQDFLNVKWVMET